MKSIVRAHGGKMSGRRYGHELWFDNQEVTNSQVVVHIVADGHKEVHTRNLDCLTPLGAYQSGDYTQNAVNNTLVTIHLFEYIATFGMAPFFLRLILVS